MFRKFFVFANQSDQRLRRTRQTAVPAIHQTKFAPQIDPGEDTKARLTQAVIDELGKSLKPSHVKIVSELPKTRNAKVLRRVVRAVHLGTEPGDLSSLENPSAVEAIRLAQ